MEENEDFGYIGADRRRGKILFGMEFIGTDTGEAVSKDVKGKLEELVGELEDEGVKMLKQQNYVMKDRAANKKKRNTLLDDWGDQCLNDCQDKETLHHKTTCKERAWGKALRR